MSYRENQKSGAESSPTTIAKSQMNQKKVVAPQPSKPINQKPNMAKKSGAP